MHCCLLEADRQNVSACNGQERRPGLLVGNAGPKHCVCKQKYILICGLSIGLGFPDRWRHLRWRTPTAEGVRDLGDMLRLELPPECKTAKYSQLQKTFLDVAWSWIDRSLAKQLLIMVEECILRSCDRTRLSTNRFCLLQRMACEQRDDVHYLGSIS